MCSSFFQEASLSGQVRAVSGSVGIIFTYTKSLQWRTDKRPFPHAQKHLFNFPVVVLEILLLDMNAFG